jgi:spore maturation protein CgeB
VLLVSTVFHTYFNAFAVALEKLNYDVVVHTYDGRDGLAGRLENRLLVKGSSVAKARIADLVTKRALTVLRETKPDVVLAIKADVLADEWWEELRLKKIPHSLWIYDELRFTKFSLDTLRGIPSLYSYSRADTNQLQSQNIDARYLPGGFDSSITPLPQPQMSPYLSFIGARYAEREGLLRQLAAAHIPIKAFGREWSRNPIDILSTGRFDSVPFETAGDVTRVQSYGVMRDSLASINHHGTHLGFNMRLFEACGIGGLHLVDRSDVSEFYEPGEEVIVYTNVDDVIEAMTKASSDSVWSEKIKVAARKRTLAQHTLVHRFDYWLRDFL